MVAVPAGPPPPSVPEGWKAHWNADHKTWFFENIYTEESTWEKPTKPVYPPQARVPLPPAPPPGYTPTVQQKAEEVKGADLETLPSPMAAMALTDGSPSYNQCQAQQPSYGYATKTQQPVQQPTNQELYTNAPPQNFPVEPAQQGANLMTEVRDYKGEPQRQHPFAQQSGYGYPPQQQDTRGAQPAYPPQQPSYPPGQPGYQPQQPGYPLPPPQQQQFHQLQQPGYPPQAQPQQIPGQAMFAPPKAPGGGFMNMLNSKVGNKVPGGAGTILGVGAGLLAGGVLAHEWEEHEERERRHPHGGFGGLGGLVKGFGGGPTVTENVTINTEYETTETFSY